MKDRSKDNSNDSNASGFASYCKAQVISALDPLDSSFNEDESQEEVSGELSDLDTSLDLETMEDPVFLNGEDAEIIEDMLTPITEDGESIEVANFDEVQENRFNYDGVEPPAEPPVVPAETLIDFAEDSVEDLAASLDAIEDILD
jgi:hypothetical protein